MSRVPEDPALRAGTVTVVDLNWSTVLKTVRANVEALVVVPVWVDSAELAPFHGLGIGAGLRFFGGRVISAGVCRGWSSHGCESQEESGDGGEVKHCSVLAVGLGGREISCSAALYMRFGDHEKCHLEVRLVFSVVVGLQFAPLPEIPVIVDIPFQSSFRGTIELSKV